MQGQVIGSQANGMTRIPSSEYSHQIALIPVLINCHLSPETPSILK